MTQMQDQVNHIASLFFNHVGSLQRDAPPAPLAKKAKHEQATEVSLMLEFECHSGKSPQWTVAPIYSVHVLTLSVFQGFRKV